MKVSQSMALDFNTIIHQTPDLDVKRQYSGNYMSDPFTGGTRDYWFPDQKLNGELRISAASILAAFKRVSRAFENESATKVLGGEVGDIAYAGQLHIADAIISLTEGEAQAELMQNKRANLMFSSLLHIRPVADAKEDEIVSFLEGIIDNQEEWNNWILIGGTYQQSANITYLRLHTGIISRTSTGQLVAKNSDGRPITTKYVGEFKIKINKHNYGMQPTSYLGG